MAKKNRRLRVIPLGGLDEIGKNITVLEYEDDILVIDCGATFPEEEMLGIDLVIPDVTYLKKNGDRIRGIVLTHGHEDHIGALPFVLKDINVPVYGTKLTLGLLESKLDEHKLDKVKLNVVKHGDKIKLGCFSVEFIRTTHSIADAVALAVSTPVGMVVHTGDFKIDYTPIEGEPMDFARFAELGKDGVLLMMCDSTNVEREGYTMSERSVGRAFNEIFSESEGRIIVATFASNVHRIQQILNASEKFNKKVAISGWSMFNVVDVAGSLGYLNIPEGLLIDLDEIDKYPNERIVLITTGTQGEPMSALSRMAASDHRKVDIIPGDRVVISASPIPGNEKMVFRVINDLAKRGADVIYEALADVHVSGHACKEELKLIHTLLRPKYFMPVHGEYRHLKKHRDLAMEMGMDGKDAFIMENGKVLELNENSAKMAAPVPAGRIFVDGLGVGDVGSVVLRDRKHLSQDGLLAIVITVERETGKFVAGPDIISRGFVYVRESEALMEEARLVAKKTIMKFENRKLDMEALKNCLRSELREFLYEKTKRKPMILPIIMDV